MIRCGILGYGYMGKIRHQVLEAHDGCSVGAIFHTEPLEGPFQVRSRWEEVVDAPDLDAVFVCLPNSLIAPAVVRALKNGKHVFAEKPPGTCLADVVAMREAEISSRRVLKFGFNHRYHPAIMKAKELVDSGDFGPILWLRGRYGKNVDPDFKNSWRSKRELSGGGIFIDQGIHMLDLMVYFCGDFSEAKAYASNYYWKGDVEDNLFALLRNEKGQTASLHSTMTQWRYLFSLELFLERGYVVVNGLLSRSSKYGPEQLSWALNRTPAPLAAHSEMTTVTYNIDPSWEMEIGEFVSAIRDGKPIALGTSEDALRLMRLVEMIYRDAGMR
jgi:1,5-anhydro-D-fructose reductase (1,5-anhydro-D-mannitol-forming)